MEIERIAIKELHQDSSNCRRHPDRNIKAIMASLKRFGQQKPVVIDHDNVVKAGNGTMNAARKLGWTHLDCVRSLLPEAELQAFAVVDNKTAELAEWGAELDAFLSNVPSLLPDFNLSEFGFLEGDACNDIMAPLDTDILPDFDRGGDLARKWGVEPGQLWGLGRHRIACGLPDDESCAKAVIGCHEPLLLLTDPFYGCGYGKELETMRERDWYKIWSLFPGAVAYVWHPDTMVTEIAASLIANRFNLKSQLVWMKSHFVLSKGHYHSQHESCWYAVKQNKAAEWSGDRAQSTVLQVSNWFGDGMDEKEVVSGRKSQKPVELLARLVMNHGSANDAVYDPFLGSGSTLIACEKNERICLGIESDPRRCAQAFEHWHTITDAMPSRLE